GRRERCIAKKSACDLRSQADGGRVRRRLRSGGAAYAQRRGRRRGKRNAAPMADARRLVGSGMPTAVPGEPMRPLLAVCAPFSPLTLSPKLPPAALHSNDTPGVEAPNATPSIRFPLVAASNRLI